MKDYPAVFGLQGHSQTVLPCSQLWPGAHSALERHLKKQVLCWHAMSGGQSMSPLQENVHIPPPQFELEQQKPPKQSALVRQLAPGPPPHTAGLERQAELP